MTDWRTLSQRIMCWDMQNHFLLQWRWGLETKRGTAAAKGFCCRDIGPIPIFRAQQQEQRTYSLSRHTRKAIFIPSLSDTISGKILVALSRTLNIGIWMLLYQNIVCRSMFCCITIWLNPYLLIHYYQKQLCCRAQIDCRYKYVEECASLSLCSANIMDLMCFHKRYMMIILQRSSVRVTITKLDTNETKLNIFQIKTCVSQIKRTISNRMPKLISV